MIERVGFYGDGSLPNYEHLGHFEYTPERNGIPVCTYSGIPRELWGNTQNKPGQFEIDHAYDHKHLLPYVPLRPEDNHCGQARIEGQGNGVALITRTANYTVLGCWDNTGDPRGNSWALFWIKGQLSANDLIASIKRDFPRIWARVTKPFGMMISAESSPDPEPVMSESIEEKGVEIPDDFFAQCFGEKVVLTPEVDAIRVDKLARIAGLLK